MSAGSCIVLIGMMGSGKSSLAPLLAAELGVDWVDVDAQVEREAKKSVERIFAEDGEERFRTLESQALARARERPQAVIALGGGAPLQENSRRLLAGCRCVYLQVAPELLAQRLGDGQGRPLLGSGASMDAQIARLIDERAPVYEELADLTVRVDKPEPEPATCRRILAALA